MDWGALGDDFSLQTLLAAGVEPQMASFVSSRAEAGRRVRSIPDFTSTLLKSQLHASRHAIRPGTLRAPAFPPELPRDPPPTPNEAASGYGEQWTASAVKTFLSEAPRKRRASTGGGA